MLKPRNLLFQVIKPKLNSFKRLLGLFIENKLLIATNRDGYTFSPVKSTTGFSG